MSATIIREVPGVMTRDELCLWRAGFGISRQRLADEIGVSKDSIYTWEAGRTRVPPWLGWALRGLAPHLRRRLRVQARRRRERRLNWDRQRKRRERAPLRSNRRRLAAAQKDCESREAQTRSVETQRLDGAIRLALERDFPRLRAEPKALRTLTPDEACRAAQRARSLGIRAKEVSPEADEPPVLGELDAIIADHARRERQRAKKSERNRRYYQRRKIEAAESVAAEKAHRLRELLKPEPAYHPLSPGDSYDPFSTGD